MPTEKTPIDAVCEALGKLVPHVNNNPDHRERFRIALVRFVREDCQPEVNAMLAQIHGEGMTEEDIDDDRQWLASEKAGIAMFEKMGKEYPGHLAINKCERLLAEVDRLRKRS